MSKVSIGNHSAIRVPHSLQEIWLEIKTNDVSATRQKIVAFEVKDVTVCFDLLPRRASCYLFSCRIDCSIAAAS
jgi:hypothetical protein